ANLSIKQGEFISIVGPSGSGKSTLLHLLGGLDRPTSGNVFFEDRDMYSLNEKEMSILRRRKFGFVFQFFNLIPVLTVEENIMLPLLIDGRKAYNGYIKELIDFLGLADRCKHLPNALSGGQQQRVAIGRALANKPSVIFADEPTGNLDTKAGREVINLFKMSVAKFQQTVVVITHDPSIAALSDRVMHIEDGRIVSQEVCSK
ncbi:MAG: ABC transporter ATP-binding protein, partial [Clostridiaceae bacterium]|nr:ABC transporter ATP-binding protein [Clostridiaceae bacterium]